MKRCEDATIAGNMWRHIKFDAKVCVMRVNNLPLVLGPYRFRCFFCGPILKAGYLFGFFFFFVCWKCIVSILEQGSDISVKNKN